MGSFGELKKNSAEKVGAGASGLNPFTDAERQRVRDDPEYVYMFRHSLNRLTLVSTKGSEPNNMFGAFMIGIMKKRLGESRGEFKKLISEWSSD
ncbi:hypothetical protein SCUCBS95973_001024 [Sporothrix curviconia]|uniref:Uncharacterized protein n=1 Tax=Sporothrix curviconia TaxID=1260050 RepID=A0ABP0AV20_9PEZI